MGPPSRAACRGVVAGRLAREADGKIRWKLVWEFLEEYRWEPDNAQPRLLRDEPSPTGDERWDALLAALAEHLAATAARMFGDMPDLPAVVTGSLLP